jgi:formylglycine-generating enzyme required for sulfatase activity
MNEEQLALALFRDACELPRGERDAFLASKCGDNRQLRRKIESMLAWDETDDEGGHEAGIPSTVRVALDDLAKQAEAGDTTAALPEIDGYRIVRRIATGGMGTVYEAHQNHPERRVAIKVANVGGTTSERSRRFQLEVQLLARLQHPGIAQILAAGTTSPASGAQPFFVMEYVEGLSLTDYATQHLHSAREQLELMVSVCRAVAFAHSQGVTHRDLKPDNVLVEANGQPKVLDFGVAKVEAAGGFGAATLRTETGRILGTMGFMAPEQLSGKTDGLGPTADVYSLGVMIYELLSGRLPHELSAVTLTQALAVVTTTDAPLLGVVRPQYRGDIEAMVAKALEKDPRHRYTDAGALQSDLERYLRGEPTLAKPAGPVRRFAKWTRRNPALATAGLGVFLGLGSTTGVLLMKNQEVRAALDENQLLLDNAQVKLARQDADTLWPARVEKAEALQRWLDNNHELVGRAGPHRAALQQLRDQAGTLATKRWTFADPLLQLRHDRLEELVRGLEDLANDTALFSQVEARLSLARNIAIKTVDDRQADWDAAIARIRHNPKYAGLVLTPQVGLVPLGEDPDSHLEEFLHFETHSGPIPSAKNGARETLSFDHGVPGTGTGIVFVLIPGGKFWMGSQSEDPNGRNYDPKATDPKTHSALGEHETEIGAFFLSKYEMTGQQWRSAAGTNPSQFKTSPLQPVERVNWHECTSLLARLGLMLPKVEQWEYAAREGVEENPPFWWTGNDEASLEGKENVFEQVSMKANRSWEQMTGESPAKWRDPKKEQRLIDDRPGPAPVGSYAANKFGLYDMGGNVTEWCSSEVPGWKVGRLCRGGNYRRKTFWARSTACTPCEVTHATEELGLRPARAIDPKPAR